MPNKSFISTDDLQVICEAEKDFEFQPGDKCVLNSGSPLMTVVSVKPDGKRVVLVNGHKHVFSSICLRPHALTRLLGITDINTIYGQSVT